MSFWEQTKRYLSRHFWEPTSSAPEEAPSTPLCITLFSLCQLIQKSSIRKIASDALLQEMEHRRDALMEHAKVDYGPDAVFRALKDQCMTVKKGQYNFEFCWLGKASQRKAENNDFVANLGFFFFGFLSF